MTAKQLIDKLVNFPENMPIMVSIPETILNDGYVSEYRLCPVYSVSMSDLRPIILVDYDRTMGEIE